MARLEPVQPSDLVFLWTHKVLLACAAVWAVGVVAIVGFFDSSDAWARFFVLRVPQMLVVLQGAVFFVATQRRPVRQRLIVPEAVADDALRAAVTLWLGALMYQFLLVDLSAG